MTEPAPATIDVLAIGNAIVDILATADEADVARLELNRGSMTLIDAARAEQLYAAMGPAREVSGGSAANTAAAVASLGGTAAFIGRVRDDELGAVFTHDLRAGGVRFESRPSADGPPTARSMIFVTADGQRTMNTYLGACVELGPDDVDPALVAAASITYLEGYLWDRPEAKAACLKAADVAHLSGRRVALTLSDPFCVGRWRDEFRGLIQDQVDILFANEAELLALHETDDLDRALDQVLAEVGVVAVTRGAAGSVIAAGEARHEIAAAPVPHVLDTTGAGDLYAAGVLRGLTAGLPLQACGRLGSAAAAAVLVLWGPRPDRPLAPLFEAVVAS